MSGADARVEELPATTYFRARAPSGAAPHASGLCGPKRPHRDLRAAARRGERLRTHERPKRCLRPELPSERAASGLLFTSATSCGRHPVTFE